MSFGKILLISAWVFSKALDPQVLHMMKFKTSMKTSYLVTTDAEQAVDKYILLDVLMGLLSIFASCAVFWRARMANKNTNISASEMLYNRTWLLSFLIC